MLSTKNLALNKLSNVLGHLTSELNSLENQITQELFPMLLLLGAAVTCADGTNELMFAMAICQLRTALGRLNSLMEFIVNLLQQLGALCSEQTRKSTVISGLHAQSSIACLANSLAVLLRLDVVVSKSPQLTAAAAAYARMLQIIIASEEQFGSKRVQQAQQHSEWLAGLQAGLLSGHCFRCFLSQRCGPHSELNQICGHQAFAQAVSGMIRDQMQAAVERIQAKAELADDRQRLLGLLCLAAVHSHICTSLGLDKKLTKGLLDLHHKIPLLPVYCNLSLHPASFLSKNLPPAADRYLPHTYVREALAEQRGQLEAALSNYALEVQQASLTVLAWQAHMAALHTSPRSSEAVLTRQAAALVRGVNLVAGLRNRLQLLLDLHAAAGLPVTQQALSLFVTSISLVKGVTKTYEDHDAEISPGLPHLIVHITSGAQGLLSSMAAKVRSKQRHLASSGPSLLQFTSTRTAADKALKDAETACEAALQVIAGPVTVEHLVMLDLCLDALKATAAISDHRMQTFEDALYTLRTLIHLKPAIIQASDCGWLYFDSHLLEPILASILKSPQDAHQLSYILAAFLDAHALLQHAPTPAEQADSSSLAKVYSQQLWSTLERSLLKPLCQHIESDLRLHHHAALLTGVPPINPKSTHVLDVTPLLDVPPLQLATRAVDIREYVEQHLTASFRSYAAVTPHDWQAYEEMRSLALDKHGLHVGAIDLPLQASDQRLDITATLQDLPSFVSSFDYSLASQMFVQQPAAAGRTAHLQTFSVQHAAAAIQVHGVALLLQAQQSVCEFVTRQLQALCDMMTQQEVQIVLEAAGAAARASLHAEVQDGVGNSPQAGIAAQHAQHAAPEEKSLTAGSTAQISADDQRVRQNLSHAQTHWLGDVSPERLVEFAEMLQTGLQEQSLVDCQQSCMDYVQDVVTGLGNAVGLLRNIQLGALQYQSCIAQFLDGSDPAQHSLHDIQQQQLQQQCASGSSVHAVVIEAQQSIPQQDNCMRLGEVVPAAILAAAERAAESKEQLTRRRRQLPDEAQIFADGFAIGIAFLLQAGEQEEVFDRLQWWKALHTQRLMQRQHLKSRIHQGNHQALISYSEGSWLKGLFKGKPQQSHTQSDGQAESLSEAELGRVQLQLGSFAKIDHELQCIQCNIEAATAIWAYSK